MSRFGDDYFPDFDYFLFDPKIPALNPRSSSTPLPDVRTQTRAYTYIPIL